MKFHRTCVLTLLLALAGCETPLSSAVDTANQKMELNGSPFRYRASGESAMTLTLLPLPVRPTKAIAPLAAQAMEAITAEEFRKGRSVANLEEVRHLQDGREVWVLNTLGEGIAYIVSFAAPSKPGTDIRLKGPTIYSK